MEDREVTSERVRAARAFASVGAEAAG